jgi:hypothetical protein
MPSGHPTKAPLIILGTMFTMSLITVVVVAVGHCNRDKPYLDSKMIKVRYVKRANDATPPPGPDAGPVDARAPDARAPDVMP